MKPTRIDQLIPSIIEHDAVSNHAFGVQHLLRGMGFASDIFADTLGPGVEGRVRHARDFSYLGDGHWALYQFSIGSRMAEQFRTFPGPKLLDYHNITPTELVARWLPPLGEETALGRRQLAELASVVDYAVADSAFNAGELVAAGYRHAEVAPVLIDAQNLGADPDPDLAARLAIPGTDWLFVGQLAPHKAQHDVISAFFRYRERHDARARLHLVGREMGSAYRAALECYVADLGLREAVSLPGSVRPEELAAYYAAADVFVCLSDHEGFCAPVVEAMARGVPVVVHDAGALSDTVADAGVVLADKRPSVVADVVAGLLADRDLVAALTSAGRRRADAFSIDQSSAAFASAMVRAIGVVGGE